MDIRGNRSSGKLTNVRSNTYDKIGLHRRQAERHGMQTDDWGREPEPDQHPSQRLIGSAMQPGRKTRRG